MDQVMKDDTKAISPSIVVDYHSIEVTFPNCSYTILRVGFKFEMCFSSVPIVLKLRHKTMKRTLIPILRMCFVSSNIQDEAKVYMRKVLTWYTDQISLAYSIRSEAKESHSVSEGLGDLS